MPKLTPPNWWHRINPRFALWLIAGIGLSVLLMLVLRIEWWWSGLIGFSIASMVRVIQVKYREYQESQSSAHTRADTNGESLEATAPNDHKIVGEQPTLPITLPVPESAENDATGPWDTADEQTDLLRKILETQQALLAAQQSKKQGSEPAFEWNEALSPLFDSLPRWVRSGYPLAEPTRVLAFTRVHWLMAVSSVGAALIATIGIWWSFFTFFNTSSVALTVHAVAWAAVMTATTISFLKYHRHVYIWDTDAVVLYRGIFSIVIATVDYSKITDLKIKRPFLGRIFGYWHLSVETAGQKQAIGNERFLVGRKQLYRYIIRYVNSRKG